MDRKSGCEYKSGNQKTRSPNNDSPVSQWKRRENVFKLARGCYVYVAFCPIPFTNQ